MNKRRKARLTANGHPNGRVCKICKLQVTDKKAFDEITERISKEDGSYSKIANQMSKKYKLKINKMNISRHKSHMWDCDLLNAAFSSKVVVLSDQSSHDASVYFIRAGKYYKIGITTNLNARIRSIMTGNPENIEIIIVKESNQHKYHEKELHEKFRHKCKRGEWFSLDGSDVKYATDYLNNIT